MFKKICKFVAVIAALCALAAAAYYAVKKLTDKDEPEYFDDNDFFECNNELEIVEVEEEPEEEVKEEPKEEPKKEKKEKKAKKEAE